MNEEEATRHAREAVDEAFDEMVRDARIQLRMQHDESHFHVVGQATHLEEAGGLKLTEGEAAVMRHELGYELSASGFYLPLEFVQQLEHMQQEVEGVKFPIAVEGLKLAPLRREFFDIMWNKSDFWRPNSKGAMLLAKLHFTLVLGELRAIEPEAFSEAVQGLTVDLVKTVMDSETLEALSNELSDGDGRRITRERALEALADMPDSGVLRHIAEALNIEVDEDDYETPEGMARIAEATLSELEDRVRKEYGE